MVAGHNDWLKKWLLSQVSFLTSQKTGEKFHSSLFQFFICECDCIFTKQNVIFSGKDLAGFFSQEWECEWPVNLTGKWSFWPFISWRWSDIGCWPAIVLSPDAYSCICLYGMSHQWKVSLCCPSNLHYDQIALAQKLKKKTLVVWTGFHYSKKH